MSKVAIIIVVLIGFSIIAGVFIASMIMRSNVPQSIKKNSNTVPVNNTTDTQTSVSSQKYEDSSGFSFNYPTGLKVYEESSNLTAAYYAYLTLESNATYGYFTASDTAYKSVDEYVFKDSKIKGAELVGATSIDGISAKQYQKDGNMFTVAYDLGVLYILQTPVDKGFWEQSHDQIIESFAFLNLNPTPAPVVNNPAGGQVIYEPEVVVQ